MDMGVLNLKKKTFVIVDYLTRKSFRNLKSSDGKVVARQLQNVAVCQAGRETRQTGKHWF